jgi:hypothetical protein
MKNTKRKNLMQVYFKENDNYFLPEPGMLMKYDT